MASNPLWPESSFCLHVFLFYFFSSTRRLGGGSGANSTSSAGNFDGSKDLNDESAGHFVTDRKVANMIHTKTWNEKGASKVNADGLAIPLQYFAACSR